MSQLGCDCFERAKPTGKKDVYLHTELQDTQCDAWKRLIEAVEKAAEDQLKVFRPLAEIQPEENHRIITLPPTIRKLKSVRRLDVSSSSLVRVPREIGEMTNLAEFDFYMSWRLHWFPFEITRCKNLVDSCVSTRHLYGNFKYRPPFPRLPVDANQLAAIADDNLNPNNGATNCSLCEKPVSRSTSRQLWISLNVATDVLPLLVIACSAECAESLPTPAKGYVLRAHTGGPDLEQPTE